LRSLVDKLRRRVRKEGVRATGKLVLRRAGMLFHEDQRLLVLLKDLTGGKPAPRDAGDLRVEEIEPRHLPALAALNRERGLPKADRRFAEDLEAGYGGFVAFRGDRLVGCYWWVDRDGPPAPSKDSIGNAIEVLGLGIELEEGDVYGADLYVSEDARGGGTAQAFLDRVEASLRERGYRRLWGYVWESNRAARWTYSLRGYVPTWRVVRTRTLSRRRSWTESMSEER
jgi:GNAT superfamily N-acetyltransferase